MVGPGRRGKRSPFRGALAVTGLVATFALGACTPTATPTPQPTSTLSTAPAAIVTPVPSPSATPTPGPTAVPTSMPEPPPPVWVDPCGIDGILCGPFEFAVERSFKLTPLVYCGTESLCWVYGDVFYPTPHPDPTVPSPSPRPEGGWPVFVLIPGGPAQFGARGDLSSLAVGLAVQGAVVIVADWRSRMADGAGYPGSFADVACAVRTGRTLARRHGGDAENVTLVAHSFGGFPSAVVAFTAGGYPLRDGDCMAARGSTKPDAFAGIAAVLDQRSIGGNYLETFYGPDATTGTGAWLVGDVRRLATARQDRTFPIALIHGGADTVVPPASSDDVAALLQKDGYSPRVIAVPDADHVTVLERKVTIAALLELARR